MKKDKIRYGTEDEKIRYIKYLAVVLLMFGFTAAVMTILLLIVFEMAG